MKRYSVGTLGTFESEMGPWVRYDDYLADKHDDLESVVKLVTAAGLSTGHADIFTELIAEVLWQFMLAQAKEQLETIRAKSPCQHPNINWTQDYGKCLNPDCEAILKRGES